MSVFRIGDRVCPILSMHMKGTVVDVYTKKHTTMLVDGPLTALTYVKVQMDPRPNHDSHVVEYRLGDLMKDE